MNSFELRIRAKVHRFSGPASWAECSARQRIGLMRLRTLVLSSPAGQTPPALFAVLTLLYGISPRQQRWLFDPGFLRGKNLSDTDVALTLDQGQSLLDTLDWIGTDDKKASFPAWFRPLDHRFGSVGVLLGRMMPQIRYYGPQAGMTSSTFQEFILAEHAFRLKDWPRLAAVLYRPADAYKVQQQLTDRREVLDDDGGIDNRSARFGRLDPALLEAIAFGFGNTLLAIQGVFKRVFPTSDEQNKNSSSGSSSPWLDVALGLAKLDLTKISAIEQSNLYLSLKVLDEQIRQAEELEAKLEKARK